MTLEEYKLGEMHFPKINSADEWNFLIFLIGITLGIIEQDWVEYYINEKYCITIGKLIGLGIVFARFSCLFNLYFHTYKKKAAKKLQKFFWICYHFME